MLLGQLGSIALVLFFIWLVTISFFLYKTLKHYKRLVSGAENVDLKAILENLLDRQSKVDRDLKNISEQVAILGSRANNHIQKVGLVRFSPFSNIGGDQSFALSILNGHDNGIVLLSLHGREGTRVYIKGVKRGIADYELSKEEKQAIDEARRSKLN